MRLRGLARAQSLAGAWIGLFGAATALLCAGCDAKGTGPLEIYVPEYFDSRTFYRSSFSAEITLSERCDQDRGSFDPASEFRDSHPDGVGGNPEQYDRDMDAYIRWRTEEHERRQHRCERAYEFSIDFPGMAFSLSGAMWEARCSNLGGSRVRCVGRSVSDSGSRWRTVRYVSIVDGDHVLGFQIWEMRPYREWDPQPASPAPRLIASFGIGGERAPTDALEPEPSSR